MLREFNLNQTVKFFSLLITLQKKNTVLGFLIGLVPILISAFSIELFIGKLLNPGFTSTGTKAISFLFFSLISTVVTQSSDGLKKYGAIIKNSYLFPTSVIISETMVQYANFCVALLMVGLFFDVPAMHLALYFLISVVCVIYCYFISEYLAVLGAVLDDFSRILSILFQMLFWVSPILFSIRQLNLNLSLLFTLNPFHIFFEGVYLVVNPTQFNGLIFYSSLASALVFAGLLSGSLAKLRQKIVVFL